MTGRKPGVEPPIANRIAELRERVGISRIELARQVGVNPQTIGYLERGDYNPSLGLAFRLADLFALPIEELFVRERSGDGVPPVSSLDPAPGSTR